MLLTLVTVALVGLLIVRAARNGEERQQVVELARRHGISLTERRIARAVAARAGARLRARIQPDNQR